MQETVEWAWPRESLCRKIHQNPRAGEGDRSRDWEAQQPDGDNLAEHTPTDAFDRRFRHADEQHGADCAVCRTDRNAQLGTEEHRERSAELDGEPAATINSVYDES